MIFTDNVWSPVSKGPANKGRCDPVSGFLSGMTGRHTSLLVQIQFCLEKALLSVVIVLDTPDCSSTYPVMRSYSHGMSVILGILR